MAEALETTVLEEDKEVAQDLLNIQSPPNILQANNQGEDDDEFQEMNPKVEEEFCEMLSTKKDDADEEQEEDDEEEVFKIKEEAEEAPEEREPEAQEEDNLFSTGISQGINFAKYEKIQVLFSDLIIYKSTYLLLISKF